MGPQFDPGARESLGVPPDASKSVPEAPRFSDSLKTAKVGDEGGYDYIFAVDARNLTVTAHYDMSSKVTMAAEFSPPPPNAPPGPAGRPARGPMVAGSFSILMVGKQ